MIGLDTTAVIDLFNGVEELIKKINVMNEPIVSTIVNYQEVFFGIDLDGYVFGEEENYYDNFFNNIEVFGLTKNASKEASKILWSLRKSGRTIDEFDSMIAGILLANGVGKIITRNKKHFEKIKGLKVLGY
jgi:predicted nucleic acid-binding protein